MIDGEVKVFNTMHAKIAPMCARNKFVSTIITDPKTELPAGSLIELSNVTVRDMQGSEPVENYSRVMYQLEIFAATKAKCREIYAAADDTMLDMNFTRISGQYMDNVENTKVFRYVARYEAIIDRDGNLYRLS